jgi:hypothetical protein
MNYVREFVDEAATGSNAGYATYLAFLVTYFVGLFLVIPLGVWHFRALRRWFPPIELKLKFWNFRRR